LSTDTEADATRCSITGIESLKAVPGDPHKLTFHCRRLEPNLEKFEKGGLDDYRRIMETSEN